MNDYLSVRLRQRKWSKSPQPPLKRGANELLLVPLFKGDLGGSKSRIEVNH